MPFRNGQSRGGGSASGWETAKEGSASFISGERSASGDCREGSASFGSSRGEALWFFPAARREALQPRLFPLKRFVRVGHIKRKRFGPWRRPPSSLAPRRHAEFFLWVGVKRFGLGNRKRRKRFVLSPVSEALRGVPRGKRFGPWRRPPSSLAARQHAGFFLWAGVKRFGWKATRREALPARLWAAGAKSKPCRLKRFGSTNSQRRSASSRNLAVEIVKKGSAGQRLKRFGWKAARRGALRSGAKAFPGRNASAQKLFSNAALRLGLSRGKRCSGRSASVKKAGPLGIGRRKNSLGTGHVAVASQLAMQGHIEGLGGQGAAAQAEVVAAEGIGGGVGAAAPALA